MLRVSVLLLVLLQVQATFADAPPPTISPTSDEIAKLVDRIEQLEKRIKELERQGARPPSVTVVPQYQPYIAPQFNPPQNQPYIPNKNSPPNNYQPAPTPHVPQTTPSIPYQRFRTNRAVPESWKPFNFNGMQYYIIPVAEADRLIRPLDDD